MLTDNGSLDYSTAARLTVDTLHKHSTAATSIYTVSDPALNWVSSYLLCHWQSVHTTQKQSLSIVCEYDVRHTLTAAVHTVFKFKFNFEIYIADPKATTCI